MEPPRRSLNQNDQHLGLIKEEKQRSHKDVSSSESAAEKMPRLLAKVPTADGESLLRDQCLRVEQPSPQRPRWLHQTTSSGQDPASDRKPMAPINIKISQ